MNNQDKSFLSTKLIPISILCLLLSTIMSNKIVKAQINEQNIGCYAKNECRMNISANPTQENPSVTGNVIYRERIALPAGSLINVKLVDISLQDVPSITISEQEIITTGQQVPIPFKLDYNPQEIKPNHTYAVQARITINEQLVFINTQSYLVITRDNPQDIQIMLTRVKSNPTQTSSFIGKWLLEDLGGTGVMDYVQTTMELTKDGKIFGSAGCNNYLGSYTIKNNQLKISPLGVTKKMCTPTVMNQESRFLQALESTGKISFNGAFLFIESSLTDKPLRFTLLTGFKK